MIVSWQSSTEFRKLEWRDQVNKQNELIYLCQIKLSSLTNLKRKYLRALSLKSFRYRSRKFREVGRQKKRLDSHCNNANPSRKRVRKSTNEDVEDALLSWFKEVKSRGFAVSGPMLRKKAKDLGRIMDVDYPPSTSWINRWLLSNSCIFV